MADIGDKLRSARKAKGMSIEDVEKITKIQRRYLTAIENNDFDQLPGDFYVRAFIRQFADVVGLNGKELLADYKSEVPEAKPEEYVENSIDNTSDCNRSWCCFSNFGSLYCLYSFLYWN